MSETDSFIDEVTEEVRRDRLFALMRKYGWIGIVAVLAIVGGAAFNEWQKAKVRAASEGFGDSILAAMESDDAGAALAAIEGVEGAQRAALLQIMIAGEAQKAGNPAEAAAALASVAQDASLPRSLRDLAQLKAVMLGDAAMDAFARAAALEQLAAPGAPYRPLAMEQQALAALAAGDRDGAISLSKQILDEAGATPGLQQRATELMVALGADPAAE